MYLYIFEDGSLRQAQLPPTNADLECIGDGILQVVTLVGAKFVEYDRVPAGHGELKLIDIPEASQADGCTIPDAE